jgi:plastocyanin domain-containing protein
MRSVNTYLHAAIAFVATFAAPDAAETKVTVTDSGFEPAKVTVAAGKPARLVFVRTSEKTCGNEVVFKDQNIERTLPLNTPVAIEFTPAKKGELAFTCGQNMFKARPRAVSAGVP